MMDYITVQEVSKRYTNHLALNKASINVPQGSIFGLLGPNGAGKTTLIRIINMITAPDSGHIFIGGEKLRMSHQEIIGYLPEERGLYKKMKVGEQAMYLAQLKGLTRGEALKELRVWFTRFDIIGWWNRKVEELSKGMQQKVQFIITVIHRPKLLIFDEPFSGFDPINATLIRDEILNLRANGATILFSTHNMSTVEELCDDIALINKSNIILKGNVKEIKQSHKTNIFELDLLGFDGSLKELLNGRFELLSEERDAEMITTRIKLKQTENPNELIATLMPHSQIVGLKEIIPTMNDIFISKVSDDTQKNGQIA